MPKFQVLEQTKNSKARAGLLSTDHGEIQTPIFMPVGTLGSVKGLHPQLLKEEVKAQIILGNTYHLYLRPGTDCLEEAGGLHSFMKWDGPILTDSGGYQVFSLAERRKITEEGVTFQSHIDGSRHLLSPERAVDIQRSIGGDLIMAFDECPPHPAEKKYLIKSLELTNRWLERCFNHKKQRESIYGFEQSLIPIQQGGVFPDLRKQSAEFIAGFDSPVLAMGGLSVGEPIPDLYAMVDLSTDIFPHDRGRYLMGVGTPANILECIALGIDMFDCVMPTRNGRNGTLFTSEGIINIKNKKWERAFEPIDAKLGSWSAQFSKAYLRHLIISKEMLGAQIASLHNLRFYLWLVNEAREKIIDGTFLGWKNELLPKLENRL